jgi:hypothetical protein
LKHQEPMEVVHSFEISELLAQAFSKKTCVVTNTTVRTLNLTQNVDILNKYLVCPYVLYIWFIVASSFW